ncbi:MAG: hypothetical protein CL946_12940 [Ectothiorhodospiraceae bacterium]|nr:hypothetical protein [Ectothiorhodospiraceae bacterium]
MKIQTSNIALICTIWAVFAVFSLNAQPIAYVLPSIGAPEFNTYVEVIAPHDAIGAYGADGFYLNNPGDNIRVVPQNPADTAKISIGPIVVSWNGRMISTHIFVHPSVTPNSADWQALDPEFQIPIQVEVGGSRGNFVYFYLVRPQPAINAAGGGDIGSGGSLGIRSKRGAMIVDSIVLGTGDYRISSGDPDPTAAGNQGFLPVTILSKGPIRAAANVTIHVDGTNRDGGPGGGGGGGNFCDVTGGGANGGNGYTGGGRGGKNGSGIPGNNDVYRAPGTGTGDFVNNTGSSLNGVEGGTSPAFEASSGGTGHPFGTSGTGCWSGSGCDAPGGYGGGSGQRQDEDGGAGGYATRGMSSGFDNGGMIHGNQQLVPLAGGSGGASGNPQGISQCSGDGGGGGGAIRLFGREIESVSITANGGLAQVRPEASGGSGSGGGIIVESKLGSSLGTLDATGGAGPRAGGDGYLRLDGPGTVSQNVLGALYTGISTDTTSWVNRRFRLTGTGNGETVAIYVKPEGEPWQFVTNITGYTPPMWSVDITLPGTADLYYLVAAQEVSNPNSAQYEEEPDWLLSQSAANILEYVPTPVIAADTVIQLPDLLCETDYIDTIFVRNEGDAQLTLEGGTFSAANGAFTILSPVFPVGVAPGDSIPVIFRFRAVPDTGGLYQDELTIRSNDPVLARNPYSIRVSVFKDVARFLIVPPVFDLGNISCRTIPIDTTFTIFNDGTVEMEILPPAITGTGVQLINPPPSGFPITIPVGGAQDVQMQIDPSQPGIDSVRILFRSPPALCDKEASVFVLWEWEDIQYTVGDLDDFGTLVCPGDLKDSTITITNNGTADIILENPTSSDSRFAILGPAFPITIPPGQSVDIDVRFDPGSPGTVTGFIEFDVQPCGIREQVTVRGSLETVQLTANPLAFGIQRQSDLPTSLLLDVTNQGTVEVTITAADFSPGSPFSVIGSVPVTLLPGETAQIEVQFDDPGADGDFSDMLVFTYNPSCEPFEIEVTGSRGEASVTIEVGSVAADAGSRISVPIYLRNARALDLFGATGISTIFRYRYIILAPQFSPAGTVVGDWREIPLTLPLTTGADEVAMRLEFIAMLGTIESTELQVINSQGIGGQVDITEVPGEFILSDVCREGGVRLFDSSVPITLAQNAPNPFNGQTRIDYYLIERGNVTLKVLDRLGREVKTLVNRYMEPGAYSAEFDANGLPSGIYFYILQTPSHHIVRTMMLAK